MVSITYDYIISPRLRSLYNIYCINKLIRKVTYGHMLDAMEDDKQGYTHIVMYRVICMDIYCHTFRSSAVVQRFQQAFISLSLLSITM